MEKITKLDVARRQIDTAIDLLSDKKDLCSVVTLAGAGEEILGRLLKRKGEIHAVDRIIEEVEVLVRELFPSVEIPSKKEMAERLNNARNHLKHLDQPDSLEFEVDLFVGALGMLNRAVDNYEQVTGMLTDNMKRFRKIREKVSA